MAEVDGVNVFRLQKEVVCEQDRWFAMRDEASQTIDIKGLRRIWASVRIPHTFQTAVSEMPIAIASISRITAEGACRSFR
jgi:hypothetical protein